MFGCKCKQQIKELRDSMGTAYEMYICRFSDIQMRLSVIQMKLDAIVKDQEESIKILQLMIRNNENIVEMLARQKERDDNLEYKYSSNIPSDCCEVIVKAQKPEDKSKKKHS